MADAITFTELFANVAVERQGVCPVCRGCGIGPNITRYIDREVIVAPICELCHGTGSMQNNNTFCEERIKTQMFMARYFHSQDPTKMEA